MRNLKFITVMTTLTSSSLILSQLSTASAAVKEKPATVTVENQAVLNRLTKTDWGVNVRAQDYDLQDNGLPKLLQSAGVRTLRYPGGSLADTYHWKNNSITPGAGYFTFPGADFDSLMKLAKATHAEPIITANYGSNSTGDGGGSPKEAAAWVKYANITKKYGVKYWEIGNENYGDWETNLHKVNSATQYAKDALQYIKEMKAVDGSIQVGLVLANPGSSGNDPNWNDTVLKIAGGKADFVIIHWYPFYQPATDQQVFDAPASIPSVVAGIRSQLEQDCGKNAAHIKIMVTETNNDSGTPIPQSVSMVNALFLTDDFMSFLEQPDVSNVDWWDLYNDGSTTSGDFGLLQDTTNTPYPSFFALRMLNLFAKPNNRLVATSSSADSVKVHAVTKGNGQLSVLLLNEDESNPRRITVKLPTYAAAPTATTYTYDATTATKITRGSVNVIGHQVTLVAPPSSISVITLTPAP